MAQLQSFVHIQMDKTQRLGSPLFIIMIVSGQIPQIEHDRRSRRLFTSMAALRVSSRHS
jgi:hypothetical protein